MGLLCGAFYTIRFREDLWPELALTLLHIHHIELDKYRVYCSSNSSNNSGGSSCKSTPNPTVVVADSVQPTSSIHNDIVSAVLLLIKHLCLNPACQEFVKPYVNTILWLCCPLLLTSSTSMVRQLQAYYTYETYTYLLYIILILYLYYTHTYVYVCMICVCIEG